MNRAFARFVRQHLYKIAMVVGGASFLAIYSKPIKYIFYDSLTKEYQEDPVIRKRIQEKEARKQFILNKVKEIKECKDPELKKKLQKELDDFDVQRIREISRAGFTGTSRT